MKFIKKLGSNFEEILCNSLLAVMLIILTYQVILRFVFKNSNAWSEELARYLFIWFIYAGASYAAQKIAHIKIDSLMNLYPKRARKFIRYTGIIIWIMFNVVVIITGTNYVITLHQADQVSLGLGIRMSYIYAAIPVGYALMTFRLVQNLIKEKLAKEN